MPELPEVETTRRKIEPLLLDRTILEVQHDAPHKYRDTHLAAGRRVTGLSRRGKYLMLHLAAAEAAHDQGADSPHDLEFIVHLGMTGGFRLEGGKHTRVTLRTDAGDLYFDDPRRFGKMAVVRPGEYAGMPTLAAMGPEPLSAKCRRRVLGAIFLADLRGCTTRAGRRAHNQEPARGHHSRSFAPVFTRWPQRVCAALL